MTPQQFIAKWRRAKLSERSACQQHFLDLCDLLGPAQARRGRPRRHALHLRAGRAQDRRRPRLGRRLDARPFRLGVQAASTRTWRPPTSNCSTTARTWKTRRCWWSATSTGSRSTPTSPNTRKRVYAFDLDEARPAGQPGRPAEAVHRAGRPAARRPRRGDHPGRRRAVRRPGQAAADAEGGVGPAGGPLPDEAHVLHVRRADRAAAVEALRPPPGDRQGQPGDAHAEAGKPLPGDGRRGRFRRGNDPPLQRRTVRRQRRGAAHRAGNQHPRFRQRLRLVERRAVDFRHALRAALRPEQGIAGRRPLHQPRGYCRRWSSRW